MSKILEYMALERPTVQFDLREGCRSAADASGYAIPNDSIEFTNKMLELLDDSEQRKKLGKEG